MPRRVRVARIRKGKPDGPRGPCPASACNVEEQLVSRGGAGPSSVLGWLRQEDWEVGNCRVEGDLCSF